MTPSARAKQSRVAACVQRSAAMRQAMTAATRPSQCNGAATPIHTGNVSPGASGTLTSWSRSLNHRSLILVVNPCSRMLS